MKKYLVIAVFFCLLMVVATAGGMYIGSLIFKQWMGLASEPSITMLYTFWHYSDGLPSKMIFPLKASTTVAAIFPVFALVLCLVGFFSKPKRELHGSARFANGSEIKKAGLLKNEFGEKDSPDLLLGKYKGKYLRWSNDSFVYLAARTRGGKGVGFVIPNCLHYRHSMVVNDVKKENFLVTAGFRAAHGQKVFFFNPSGTMPYHDRDPGAPLISHRWNALTYVRRNPVYTHQDSLFAVGIF